MGTKKSLLTTLLVLLTSSSFAQQNVWAIQYKGEITVYVDSQPALTLWRRQAFDSLTSGDIGDAGNPSGSRNSSTNIRIVGTVTVRRKWLGLLPPSAYPNYVVDSTAWGTGNGTVVANNGFKTETSRTPNVRSLKLVQPGKVDPHETPVTFSVVATGGYGKGVGASLSARFDGRYARVKANSIPEEYYDRETATVKSPPINWVDQLWDGNYVRKTAQYDYYPRKSVNPVRIGVGASRQEYRIVGLPQGYQVVSGTILLTTISPFMNILYVGEASTQHLNGEWYRFKNDHFGTDVSETLPSFGGGWDVEPLGTFSYEGGIVRETPGVNIQRIPKGAPDFDSAELNYRWTDGLEADSGLYLTFVERFANRRLVGSDTIHEGGARRYVFKGPYNNQEPEYQPYDNGGSKPVKGPRESSFVKAAAGVVSFAGAALALVNGAAEAAAIAALMGQSITLGIPDDPGYSLGPDHPFNPDVRDAVTNGLLVKHEVTISDPLLAQRVAAAGDKDAKLNLVSGFLEWRAEYIPMLTRMVNAWEVWDATGYVSGQHLETRDGYIQDPTATSAKKFVYRTMGNGGNATP